MGDTSITEIDFSMSLLLSGIIGMLLLAVGLVFFFVVYQRRIYNQQVLMLEKNQLHQRELLAAAVEVQESERRRIAGDLHDDIGSLLSAARLYLRQFDPHASEEVNEKAKTESLKIVSTIIQNTRRITHDLMPSELEKFGLFAAAEDLCERINGSGQIKINLTNKLTKRFDPKKEIALYRVLQELINNTIKHAEAHHIAMEYSWRQDHLFFRYKDDGIGFDTSITNQRGGSGLGLRNIESRISLIGGTLDYQSTPGNGLLVSISVPVFEMNKVTA